MTAEAEAVAQLFANSSDHKMQVDQLTAMLERALPTNVPDTFDISSLMRLIEAVVNQETGSMVVSRQLVGHAISRLEGGDGFPTINNDIAKKICLQMLAVLQSRAISYEEQICSIRMKLATLLELEGNRVEAAQVLMLIPLESGQRQLSPQYKLDMYLRIGTLFLEGDDAQAAENAVTRASMLLAEMRCDNAVIQHKALYARVLDRRRRFLDAAQRYYEISTMPHLPNSDQMEALRKAITCTILAQPGVQRGRMLSTFYKDDRSRQLRVFGLLEKMYLERIVKNEEFVEFENALEPHQKTDDNGERIVRKAMIEYNITAASRIYTNISFDTLAELIGMDASRAERIVAEMIANDRVRGAIDQETGIVLFEESSPLREWDEQIGNFCEQVNYVYDMIVNAHPEFVASLEATN